jgi:hypothetical protein
MNYVGRLRAFALAAVFALGVPLGTWSLSQDIAPSIETTPTTLAGTASLLVRAFGDNGEFIGAYGGAGVYIDRVFVGYAPYTTDSTLPGAYLLSVAADGYYPQEIRLYVEEKNLYTIIFTLRHRTGRLSLTVNPTDAAILIDGAPRQAGVVELSTGAHKVTVRHFGYVEKTFPVSITEDQTSTLLAQLDPAPFEVSGLEPAVLAFDPRNAGRLGRCPISFRVNSWGSGRLEVLSPTGEAVGSFDFARFETWDQQVVWRGRDSGGSPLPDGRYRLRLEIRPESPPGTAPSGAATNGIVAPGAEVVVREAEVTIDSRLAVSPYSSAGAVVGLLHFPEPGRIPAGVSATGLAINASTSTFTNGDGAGVEASFAHSFGSVGIGASAGLKAASPDTWDAALSAAIPLEKMGSPFAAALFVRPAAASATGQDSPWTAGNVAGAISTEVSLPFSIAAGAFRAGLAPGVLLAFPFDGTAIGAQPMLRAGLWYAGSRLRAGLSAIVRAASFGEPLGPAWPMAAAAEVHMALDPTPLVLAAAATVEFQGAGAPTFGLQAGLDLLF